jgi:hypothetical protein
MCIAARDGKAAAMQVAKMLREPPPLCREVVTHLIAGASWFTCALLKGHKEVGHRAAGNCLKHGPYLGDPWSVPQCPKWPDCARPSGPSAPKVEKEINDVNADVVLGHVNALLASPDSGRDIETKIEEITPTETASAPQNGTTEEWAIADKAARKIVARIINDPHFKKEGLLLWFFIGIKQDIQAACVEYSAAAPSVAGTQPTPTFNDVAVWLRNVETRDWNQDERNDIYRLLIGFYADFCPGAAQGTPQVEAAISEIVQYFKDLHSVTYEEMHEDFRHILRKHGVGAPAQPGPEEKR